MGVGVGIHCGGSKSRLESRHWGNLGEGRGRGLLGSKPTSSSLIKGRAEGSLGLSHLRGLCKEGLRDLFSCEDWGSFLDISVDWGKLGMLPQLCSLEGGCELLLGLHHLRGVQHQGVAQAEATADQEHQSL